MAELAVVPADSNDRSYLEEKIVAFNASQVPFTQTERFIRLDYIVKNEPGVILGGITSYLYYWKCLFIDILWVDENYRKLGIGSKLIRTLEEHAQKLGCKLIHVDTFDFQAKDFYLKNGYQIFGELKNCPPEHTRFYLKKDFTK